MSAVTPEAVLDAIDAAFGTAPYPGDDRIAGRFPSCPDEYAYVATYFKGKHWREITLKGLREEYPGPPDACLSFMSSEAFRFYLPAYMWIAVEAYEAADVVAEAAVFALTPPREDERLFKIAEQAGGPGPNPFSPEQVRKRHSWWLERVSGLTGAQRRAVIVFLQSIDQSHGSRFSREALDYWSHAG